MRILATSPTYFPIVGGAELLIDDVLTMLAADHQVRLLTPHLPEDSRPFWVNGAGDGPVPYDVERFEDRYDLLDLRGHRVTRGLIPPMSLSGVGAIGRAIKRFRPDVLVTFFGVPLGLPSVLMQRIHGVPLVVVLCGSDVPSPRTRPVPFWSAYIRAVTDAADRAVYVSESTFRALHEREMRPGHDLVIHGGVDASRLVPRDPHALRAHLGIGPHETMLFTLSRLGPEKRVDVVVRAFARLHRRHPGVRLVVGGLGSELPALRALARDLGVEREVVFPGYIDEDKADYFAAADIFVFHSLFETFGQVLAEAMAMGKPVVSVSAGAIPEVVDDGVTGLIVEPENPVALAGAIERLLDTPALLRAFGEAGRDKAERNFSWRSQAIAWAEAVRFDRRPRPVHRPVRKEVEDDALA